MVDLKPEQLQALHDALPSTIVNAPVAEIKARGAKLRRRRHAAAALASAGSLVAGVAGLAALGGSGQPATLGVTTAPTTAPVASTSPSPTQRPSHGPMPRLSNAPCPPMSSPSTPPEDLINPRDTRRSAGARAFNAHAIAETLVMQAVAARVHDRAFAVAQADGAADDLIIWRLGGATGASPAYASATAKAGIQVVFKVAVLSAGETEQTEGTLFRSSKVFAASGVNLNSTLSDGHGVIAVGVDPLTDAARRIAIEHAPYGAASITLVCDPGAYALGALSSPG